MFTALPNPDELRQFADFLLREEANESDPDLTIIRMALSSPFVVEVGLVASAMAAGINPRFGRLFGTFVHKYRDAYQRWRQTHTVTNG